MHLSDFMAYRNPDGRILSDEEVAAAISRSRVTVSRIRRRKVRPDWETIKAIETFTGGLVTANDFVDLPVDGTSSELADTGT